MTTNTPQLDSFTPDDLRAAVILIDYACEQGAFKGWDNINKAFLVRTRINAFVEQWAAVSDAKPEDQPETTPAQIETDSKNEGGE